MTYQTPSDEVLRDLLASSRVIAVVGASSNPEKASYGVMKRLLDTGFRVIPVNPRETEVLGQPAFATLRDIPEPVDIVDVFRRPEHTPSIAEEAVAIGAKALWLQVGVVSSSAADIAKRAGLIVVMDQCIAVVHGSLVGSR